VYCIGRDEVCEFLFSVDSSSMFFLSNFINTVLSIIASPADIYEAEKQKCLETVPPDSRDTFRSDCLPTSAHLVELNGGFFARTFVAADVPIIVKISRIGSLDLCTERATLSALDGLGDGSVPRVLYPEFMQEAPKTCYGQAMAMEMKGTDDWIDAVVFEDRRFYARVGRLIEILRCLHEAGFVHQDLSGENVRIDDQNDQVFLIDFGHACRRNSRTPRCSPKLDMIRLVAMLNVIRGPKTWMGALALEMNGLRLDERPSYENWISFFRTKSAHWHG
jgi:hypothetical protein